MEQFVKRLYDRLEDNKELQMQLLAIMDNAINEIHNSGIIAGLTGEAAQRVHNPDPEVRVKTKTSLAKAVGKQFIPVTMPVPSGDGIFYLAKVEYDPRFVNSITLCFQGGLEGLHMASSSDPEIKLDKYCIQVESGGNDVEAFRANIEQLDRMYDDISVELEADGKVIYRSETNATNTAEAVPADETPSAGKPRKKGFLTKIFGKI